MNYTDHTSSRGIVPETSRQIGFTKSPLASAVLQARNFTAVVTQSGSNIAPDFYSAESLGGDIERLCDPHYVITDEDFLNVAVKFFFAYVHDGSHNEQIPYAEIADLYEQFSRHHSMNEPGDDIEVMNLLRQWSPVLRVLADAPRAAHVMRAVIGQRDVSDCNGGPYVGVDVGAGTGIMLLAQQIQARRRGSWIFRRLGIKPILFRESVRMIWCILWGPGALCWRTLPVKMHMAFCVGELLIMLPMKWWRAYSSR